jgi:hypothetical protein
VALFLYCSNIQAGEANSTIRETLLRQHLLGPTALILLVLIVIILRFLFRRTPPKEQTALEPVPEASLSDQQITQSFLAAIPRITRQLNLEIATSTQTEVFERAQGRTVLWGALDLGTNLVQIHLPVTYRYHVRLQEAWRLEVRGKVLVVRAPPIRPSLPPAIHSDQMRKLMVRGWGRLPPDDLLEELERQMTPILCDYAADARHLELVRHQCRLAVADFVRLCLRGQTSWPAHRITAIDVQFADEPLSTCTLPLRRLNGDNG